MRTHGDRRSDVARRQRTARHSAVGHLRYWVWTLMRIFRLRLGRGRRRRGTARRPSRFRNMLNNRALWPGMIGIALSVGFGVQMGESTIGSINPIHFQGPAPPVQAIDPNAPPPPTSPYAQAYGWEQGYAARQAEAGNIAATSAGYPDFDYLPEVRVHRAAEPVWQEGNAPTTLAPWPPGQVSSHPEVERYTDYPVEEKPTAQPAPAAPPAARAEAPQPDASALSTAASLTPAGK